MAEARTGILLFQNALISETLVQRPGDNDRGITPARGSIEPGDSSNRPPLRAQSWLDPDFAREFQRAFIVPRKQELVALLQRGVWRGELAADTNLEVLADLIYGAKWYRFLLYPAPLDEEFAREIVTLILRLRAEA